MGIGTLAGGLNATLITRLRIPPLIVTLGSYSLFRGLAEGMTRGVDNFTGFPGSFLFLGQGYLLGGVPWSNIWFSGLLTVTCYMGARLAVRWASPARVATSVGPGAMAADPLTLEDRAKGLLFGAASVWAAFYVSLLVQIVWYAITQPWVATPKPF